MKKNIKRYLSGSKVFNIFLNFYYELYRYYYYHLLPEKIFLKKRFYNELGYHLNLKNPKTFNEKLQWLKLYDRSLLHTICADKHAVREYIKKEIGDKYLIPVHRVINNIDELKVKNLPDYPCIIKTTHDSANYEIVYNKSDVCWKELKRKMKKSLKNNFYYFGKEWQYKNIKPKIIIEKLLIENNDLPVDYKFHCFNGKVEIIQVNTNRKQGLIKTLYDKNWNILDFSWNFQSSKKNYQSHVILIKCFLLPKI